MTVIRIEDTVEVGTTQTVVSTFGGGERTYLYVRNDGAGALTDFTIQVKMALPSDWENILDTATEFSTPTAFLLTTSSINDPNLLTQGQQYQATLDLSLVYQARIVATAAATTDLSFVVHP